MLDLGLTKIAVIGMVALVVIGPEKLPHVARMAGKLYGRAQRYLTDVKSEVSRELDADGLRSLNADVLNGARGIQSGVASLESNVESMVSTHMDEVGLPWQSDMAGPTAAQAAIAARASQTAIERKARNFRSNKLVRTSGVPAWYKNRQGTRQRVLSGAARARTGRPAANSPMSFF